MKTDAPAGIPLRIEGFSDLAKTITRLGGDLLVLDEAGQCLFQAGQEPVVRREARMTEAAQQVFAEDSADVRLCGPDPSILACVLRREDSRWAVIVDPGPEQDTSPNAPSRARYVEPLLRLFVQNLEKSARVEVQLDKLSTELGQCYEQIMLLYNLSTNMNLTQTNANYLQRACDQLTQLVRVEGIAIFIEKKMEGMKRLVLTAGSGMIAIDPVMADILHMHLSSELAAGREALLDSRLSSPSRYNWPDPVRTILAVPIGSADRLTGFLVATNILSKPDFDNTDIKLFSSVASQCMVFIENGRLFTDLKELFIGSLKALTNSIDAKDQYTRGHSERVAMISRWIAEHLRETRPLTEKQIHHVYLSGLLHDIGKIGVAEAVLRKHGKLTDEERSVILAHPRIGASILSEIPQMRDIVPGILYHHERYDGKGYPEGLCGEEIPLSARIIGLADAFDAMTSKRVYRDAMSIRRALSEIEKESGSQFDPAIAGAFLASNIERLWKIIQDGFIETWDYSNFAEYGTRAVGALIR